MAKPRIAWDSCVFIDAIQAVAAEGFYGPLQRGVAESVEQWPEIEPMLQAAEEGKIEILASEIVVAETCHLKKLGSVGVDADTAIDMIRDTFDAGYIVRVPVGREESTMASELRRKHSLGTCDAIIAASACINRADHLYTRDGHRSPGEKVKHGKLLAIDGILPNKVVAPNAASFMDAPLWEIDE